MITVTQRSIGFRCSSLIGNDLKTDSVPIALLRRSQDRAFGTTRPFDTRRRVINTVIDTVSAHTLVAHSGRERSPSSYRESRYRLLPGYKNRITRCTRTGHPRRYRRASISIIIIIITITTIIIIIIRS